MKICFFGIYDSAYSRNAILLKGLRQAGAEVVECQADWKDPRRYFKLWNYLKDLKNDYDFIYAAYPSPVPAILARILSSRPVVTDAFYSMFDSVVNDRKKFKRFSLIAIKLLILDWLSVLLAHVVISDTEEHKKYWSSWWLISKNKIHTVYLGIDEDMFYPKDNLAKDNFLVHFHGTYIPLQGACKIIEAASLCKDDPRIRFRMIGNGREFPKAKDMSEKYGLTNIEFMGNVPLADLSKYMSQSHAALGIFGDTSKAFRVIPNKIYEGLACCKAMISMDTKAIREIFSDKDLLLVKNEPIDIANAIKKLANDESMRSKLASHGYETASKYNPVAIGRSLIQVLEKYNP